MFKPPIAIAAVALFAASAAAAQPSQDDLQQACQADVQKFCADVQPGGGAVTRCMRQHALGLSSQCKAAWMAHKRAQSGSAAASASNSAEPNP